MKVRSDYKICTFCGCTLDLYEVCDCKRENRKPAEIRPAYKDRNRNRHTRNLFKGI